MADGTLLLSMVVFIGQPWGNIMRMEFVSYTTTTNIYHCQQANARMDETVMMAWVDKVLVPYVAQVPDHVVLLIILDSDYHCHMMECKSRGFKSSEWR